MTNIEADRPWTFVALTKGFLAMVDIDDLYIIWDQKWHAERNKETDIFYAINGKGVYMHRLLLDAPDHLQVDHKDGNGLNNIRTNIRLATCAQNQHNALARKNCSSIYKGVYWRKDRNKWRVKIKNNGVEYSLGCFNNEIWAALIFDEAARLYHGEFACVNFPKDGERSAI